MRHFKFWLLNGSILLNALISTPIVAQIAADNTLGAERSRVTENVQIRGRMADRIDGGAVRGSNLFHSFERFNVRENQRVYFNNPDGIETILTRVSGGDRSTIRGTLGVDGNADLFLLNPRGIIFGPAAQLDIRGSFLATTARSFRFDDGSEFSATNPQPPSLLAIHVPIGLQFGRNPEPIRNESLAVLTDATTGDPILDDGSEVYVGLQADPGQTFALIGGKVTFAGGIATLTEGRAEIGSVAGPGFVGLNSTEQGWTLNYEQIQNFDDIHLFGLAAIETWGDRSSDIHIQGRRVRLTEGSYVFSAVIQGNAGELTVNASELVELVGTSSFESGGFVTSLSNQVRGTAIGEGGRLAIETRRLILRDGAQLSTSTSGTSGQGRGVPLRINASDSVDLIGNTPDVPRFRLPSGVFARVATGGTDDGGDLSINTRRLTVRDGAQISTDTFGAGRAGALRVVASDSVELSGRTPDNAGPSGLFAQVDSNATGDGGTLSIETRELTVLGGAQISTSARNGGQGGRITINASDFIRLSGTAPIDDDSNISGVLVSAEPGARRDAGALDITTRRLTIEEGARISADNFGSGNRGGNATLRANQIILNRGEIKATTETGRGGTVTLENVNLLSMQNGSRISARAFNEADGGNVTINAANGFVITAPGQDNDIIGSAVAGQGGNINIQAQGIIGIEERRAIAGNRTNDIDASSEFGAPGTVTINRPEADPSTGLVELPTSVVDSSTLIARGCSAQDRTATASSGRFVMTGRGGLPPTPDTPRGRESVITNWVALDDQIPQVATNPAHFTNRSEQAIAEAQGWIIDATGEVILTAQAPTANSFPSALTMTSCTNP